MIKDLWEILEGIATRKGLTIGQVRDLVYRDRSLDLEVALLVTIAELTKDEAK